jgi:hypothetical protein
MGATGVYGLRYPEVGDPPNGPDQIKNLAEDTEDEFVRIDADIAAAEAVTALFATGVTVSSFADTSGTTTSTTFTETLTGGTACATTFVAPQSGKVIVHNSAFIDNNATGRSYCSWIIRNGGTIGSGTTFLDGDEAKSIACLGTDDVEAGRATLVTGLTAGATYNIRQRFKVSAGTTGTFQYKELIVEPKFL